VVVCLLIFLLICLSVCLFVYMHPDVQIDMLRMHKLPGGILYPTSECRRGCSACCVCFAGFLLLSIFLGFGELRLIYVEQNIGICMKTVPVQCQCQ